MGLFVAIRDYPALITFALAAYFRVIVDHLATSVLDSLADIQSRLGDVGFVPEAEVSHGQGRCNDPIRRNSFNSRCWNRDDTAATSN